ncbi:MAG: hypothetical protein ACRDSL_27635 [Pseudonocardiaceae bacterium]
MSLLDVVRWPALYRDAHGRADQRTRGFADAAHTVHDAARCRCSTAPRVRIPFPQVRGHATLHFEYPPEPPNLTD